MKQPIKKFKGYELLWYTDKEVVDFFKDGLDEVLAVKIPEIKDIIEEKEADISKRLKRVEDMDTDDFSKLFGREIIGMELLPKIFPYDSEFFQLNKYARLLNPTSTHISNFQEKLDTAKSRPIAEVIGRYMELKQAGNKLIGLCPFHNEKTPSFHIYAEQGQYHCYGCQAHGDAINFIKEFQGVDFKNAVDILQN